MGEEAVLLSNVLTPSISHDFVHSEIVTIRCVTSVYFLPPFVRFSNLELRLKLIASSFCAFQDDFRNYGLFWLVWLRVRHLVLLFVSEVAFFQQDAGFVPCNSGRVVCGGGHFESWILCVSQASSGVLYHSGSGNTIRGAGIVHLVTDNSSVSVRVCGTQPVGKEGKSFPPSFGLCGLHPARTSPSLPPSQERHGQLHQWHRNNMVRTLQNAQIGDLKVSTPRPEKSIPLPVSLALFPNISELIT